LTPSGTSARLSVWPTRRSPWTICSAS
jgi:hypothetical protein